MDERDWQTFVTVVGEGNITKAADKLFLSQPALSYRLRQMEMTMGYPLLIRTNEGIVLTPQGELYYTYCQHMLTELEQLKQTMGAMNGEIQGTLTLASSINFADYQLPKLLKIFSKRYPKIHIKVKTGYSAQVKKMFNAGEVMVAIARGEGTSKDEAKPLFEEPYCLVYKEKVNTADLVNIPLIQYRTDPSIAMIITNWCYENLPPEYSATMELDSMMTCRQFVKEGLGWAILPYLGLESFMSDDLYMEPLNHKDGSPIVRNTYLYYSEISTKLIAVKTFIDFLEEYYKEYKVMNLSNATKA